MPMPLKTLLDFDGNSYEVVSAVIKRAQQLTDIRVAYNPTTLEDQHESTEAVQSAPAEVQSNEKAVSIAFQEIFDGAVTYKIKDEE